MDANWVGRRRGEPRVKAPSGRECTRGVHRSALARERTSAQCQGPPTRSGGVPEWLWLQFLIWPGEQRAYVPLFANVSGVAGVHYVVHTRSGQSRIAAELRNNNLDEIAAGRLGRLASRVPAQRRV
jgi:hypothetical protein